MSATRLGTILVVDDETELLAVLSDKLTHQGYDVVACSSPRAALETLRERTFDLMLTDLMMPEMDGVSLLKAALELDGQLAGIIMTGQATVPTAVEALKTGAMDYILKPFKTPTLLPVLARAIEIRRLRLENIQLRETVAIHDLCKAISFTAEIKTILHKLAESAAQQCEAEEASIMLPTSDGGELRVSTILGGDRAFLLGQEVPIDEGIAGWVARNREPVVLQGEVSDPRFAPVHPRTEIRSSICMPLLSGGRFVGVLNVNATRRRRPFSLGEVKALDILASAGAAAIEGALLLARLRAAEARYRSIFENAVEGIVQTTPRGAFHAVNPAMAQMLGYRSADEFVDGVLNFQELHLITEEYREFQRRLEGDGVVQGFESRFLRRDGQRIWVSLNGRAVRGEAGTPGVFEITAEDVTARKLAEKKFRELLESAPDAMVIVDESGSIVLINSQTEWMFGYPRADLLGRPVELLMPKRFRDRHPEHRASYFTRPSVRAMGANATTLALVGLRKDGSEFPIEISLGPLQTEEGLLVSAAIRDITERRRAEESLRQAEENYRNIVENAVDGIFQRTSEGRFLSANPALARICGYESPADFVAGVMDARRDLYADPQQYDELNRLLAKQGHVRGVEIQARRKDGQLIWISETVRAVRDTTGQLLYHEGFVEDVTERRQLEEQFRQSQKMEAVGQLAGGLAHDFNNLLTVINGYSEVLFGRLGEGGSERKLLSEIQKASERATTLTRQLLAFSRKQVLQPRVLNLNTLIAGMASLLRRLIGENMTLTVIPAPDLGLVKIDPSQFEQVIMNLAINARDAMPEGGILTLETQTVERTTSTPSHPELQPGRYVLLTVRDTGCGMSIETQAHIFEPFFTTKEAGKGTGLGLAVVYGIVQQSEGFIEVTSQVGCGSAFQIHLPCVEEKAVVSGASPPLPSVPAGTETVLLVEDEEGVRRLASMVLQSSGYRVLEAKDGEEALQVSRQDLGQIDLLVTDVVMPQRGGPQLAELLAQERPGIKRLFMSGYGTKAMDRGGQTIREEEFLQKPFSPLALAHKVRELLDEGKESSNLTDFVG
jgi:two-component system, cell cycle sensor histidine kinase and response regulator CckA